MFILNGFNVFSLKYSYCNFNLFQCTSRLLRQVRRWTTGRLVCLNEHVDDNLWLNASELSVAGRPLQQMTVTLPRQRDLVLPESTDASSDLRLAERPRPSPEQLRAQKGSQRLQALFSSLLTVAEHQWDGPVVLVNFTPYVEDGGLAVSCHC